MRGKIKSLNGYNPITIKNKISNILGIDIIDIKLFGSRISCIGWTEDSDLDIAITGEYCKDMNGTILYEFNMKLTIHWVEDFGASWLHYAI